MFYGADVTSLRTSPCSEEGLEGRASLVMLLKADAALRFSMYLELPCLRPNDSYTATENSN